MVVEITLLNVIERLPEFEKSSDDVRISEKTLPSQLIYRALYTSPEIRLVQILIDKTKTSQAAQDLFFVNSFSGEVKVRATAQNLDFEAGKTYDLHLYLFNPITRQAFGTETFMLRISILDVNDNSPVFNKNLNTASIYENATVGSAITTVTAKDQDGTANANIRYFILLNYYSDKFAIDERSGVITLASKVDFEANVGKYVITVCANDSAVDKLQTKTGNVI